MQERLAKRRIHVAVHYPTPVHLQPAAREWGYGPGDFPHAEALARETWQQTLALGKLNLISSELSQAFASRKISGSSTVRR